jgi:hypothetical protein
MMVNFAKSLNATLIKDLAKLLKHAEEEPFLDDAENPILPRNTTLYALA